MWLNLLQVYWNYRRLQMLLSIMMEPPGWLDQLDDHHALLGLCSIFFYIIVMQSSSSMLHQKKVLVFFQLFILIQIRSMQSTIKFVT